MDSLTKNKKDRHEIIRLFQRSLSLETDIASVAERTAGSFNAVYQITLSNQEHFVLKIAPNASTPILRNEKNIMQAEVQALQLIRKHTSIPVPEVLYASDDLSECDSPFLIMQWMRGEEYQYASNHYPEETKRNVLFQLGAMTYEFHQIHGTAFGVPGIAGTSFSTWSEAFFTLFENILSDGMEAGVSLPFAYDYLLRLGQRVRPYFRDVTTPCLIHGDLWLGNVLVDHGKISALLDFERSLWGDPLMEYPFGLLRNNSDFLAGYGHNLLDDGDFSAKIRRAIYNLYHYFIVIIEKPFRGFPGGNSNYFINQKMIAEVESIEKLLLSETCIFHPFDSID